MRGNGMERGDATLPALVERTIRTTIGAAFTVSNALGVGYLEAVYRRSLAVELALRGMSVDQEVPFDVNYRGETVGRFQADTIVGGCVVVETKACDGLSSAHLAQVLNYLRCSGLRAGLLLNFGTQRVQVKRVVL